MDINLKRILLATLVMGVFTLILNSPALRAAGGTVGNPNGAIEIGFSNPQSDEMNAGRWNPQTTEAQKNLVDSFKKKYDLK